MLARLGWNDELAREFVEQEAQGRDPARVAVGHRGGYEVYTAAGTRPATLAPHLSREAETRADLPAVGDWVALEDELIHAVLSRRTKFSRRAASDQGRQAEEQVVAANVDTVFLVHGLDLDFNVRRLERYLTLGWESGAQPVVVLTKTDLCDDVEGRVLETEAVAPGVRVHPVSAVAGEGIEGLAAYFGEGQTVAALGSSGAGKSTLVNALAGEELMATGGLRADGRGRHTTVHRELILLPGGGLYLDTPGMRELRLWEAETGLETAFADVSAYVASCRFADCGHQTEPGCAVRAALASGALDAERYASWRKLQGELVRLERMQDKRLLAEARKERRRAARSRRKTAW